MSSKKNRRRPSVSSAKPEGQPRESTSGLTPRFNAPTLGEAAEGGRGANNFDVLRLFAAACVVFAHSFLVVGTTAPIPGSFGIEYGQFGVMIFFAISGFLVARSWDYDPRLFTFAMKRLLRLLPALLVALLLTALVLGPLLTTEEFGAYLQNPQTKLYVLSNAILQRYDLLPGLFQGNTVPDINRSLWTLPVEVKAYCLVAVLGLLGFFRRVPIAMVLFGVLVALLLTYTVRNWLPYANNATAFLADIQMPKPFVEQARSGELFVVLQPFVAFVIATMLYRVRKWIPLSWWLVGLALAALVAIAIVSGENTQNTRVAAAWVLPLVVLVAAYRTQGWFRLPSRMGDYSYGIYIFAFPIQQAIVYLVEPESGWVVFTITAPIVLVIAMLSWHFVEGPSLTLKQRLAPVVDAESAEAVAHPVGREELASVRLT